MPPNSPSENKQSKRQSTDSMKHYLWENAEKIKAERDAKKLAELEKENFKSAYISKYQKAVLEAQDRFVGESKLCDDIFKSIAPTLQEIINFAEQHSIFPPEMEKIPDILPVQFFYNLNTPRVEPNLRFYYSPSNDEIVSQYQSQTASLIQEHVYLDCGINWGYMNVGETYGTIYGIKVNIFYNGEIKIGETSFTVSELSSKEFKKALSDVFYSPVRIRIERPNPRLTENATSEKESTMPITKRLVLNIITFFHHVKNFWIIVWSEPQSEINIKTPFLKKLWYGFPIKNKSDDESS